MISLLGLEGARAVCHDRPVDMVVASVDWAEVAGIIVGSGGVLALLAAGVNAWLGVRSERRRTQPVVICHEHQRRTFASSATGGCWQVFVWLTNEGGGPAFNVRFGVEMRGVRFPFRGSRTDGDPHRYRVVRPGDRMPEPAAGGARSYVPIILDGLETWGLVDGSKRSIDDGRRYWCRYENGHGKTWETNNPADATGDLRVRRVRVTWWHERRDQRALARVRRGGVALERGAVDDLRAGMKQGHDEAAEQAEPPAGASSD